jgi:nucleoside-diphosphate-sugar epimerase
MKNKVLVAGASGLIGVAAIEAFLSAGWEVVGISRRKPYLPSGRDFDFISVDLRDRSAAHGALSSLADVTHVAYAAIYENASDLVSGWSNTDQIAVNNAMLHNVIEPIISGKPVLKHVSILQGTKAYGVHLHPIAIPARESDPRDDHANFFFDQQDYVRDMGARHGFTYTALRPQLVTGETPGALNVLPAIGVYAAIRREKGKAFSFPGGPSFVWESADANLVGQVMVWAAQAKQAANEIFNVTNGDVFAWRSVWPAMAQTLGVELGSDKPTSLAMYIQSRSRKSAQGVKWSFCLTAGTLLPANQERPCRDDHAGTTHRLSKRRWRLPPSRAIGRWPSLPSSSTCTTIRSRRGKHSSRAGLPMCSVLAAATAPRSLRST